MTYAEAQKVQNEGWIWDRKATDADRAQAREVIAKIERCAPHPADGLGEVFTMDEFSQSIRQ